MHSMGIESLVLQITRQALMLVVVLSGIPVVASMVVGVFVSVFQAATQIQEQSLVFVPKAATLFAGLTLCGGWMLTRLVDFTRTLFLSLPHFVR